MSHMTSSPPGAPRSACSTSARAARRYRRRLQAQGLQQVITALPKDMVEQLDRYARAHGLRGRSQALERILRETPELTEQPDLLDVTRATEAAA